MKSFFFATLQQLLLIFLLLSGILYMLSLESFTGKNDDTPAFVFPIKYNADDFLRRKAGISAIQYAEPQTNMWHQNFKKVQTSFSLRVPR